LSKGRRNKACPSFSAAAWGLKVGEGFSRI
jgi:hypothetical protein